MGLFIRQFGALFWKNWLCRIRQPILCVSELLWPCALFLILAAIRSQEPPVHVENCYVEPRNLPSHGIYPFIKSLICNAGSRCRDVKYFSETQNISWNLADDLLTVDLAFLKEIQELSQDILNTTEQMVSLYESWKEVFNFKSTSDTEYLIEKLNNIENILQEIEKVQEQTFFWNLLVLPWLNGSVTKSYVPADIVHLMEEFLKIAEREGLDIFSPTTGYSIKGIRDFNETFQMMQYFFSEDLKYALHFWNSTWEFINQLESMQELYKQQTEKPVNFSLWHEILSIRSYIQTLLPFGMGLNISHPKKNLSVNSKVINEHFELFNILTHLQPNGVKDILKLDEETFTQIFLSLQEVQLSLKLSKTIIKHAIKVLNFRKEAIKYLQIIAPFLKNVSVDQTRINSVVNKITEILLNENSSSCENVFEFLQISFQFQEDASITKDITLLFCSYFKSFHLSNVIDDSEKILESNLDMKSVEEQDKGWKEVNHLLQENIHLSSILSHFWDFNIPNTNEFHIKNMSSLFQYISDELEFTIESSQLWEEITEIITQDCIFNHPYKSEIRYINSIALANLCLRKSYDWTTFVESFLQSLENVKRLSSLLRTVVNKRTENDVSTLFLRNFNMSNQYSGFMKETPLFIFKDMLTELQDRALLNQLVTWYQQLKQAFDDKYSHSGFHEWLPIFYYITGKFPYIFPVLKHDVLINYRDEYALFKFMFHQFLRLDASNCSEELKLLQQYFNETRYNNRTNTDKFNIKMAAYLKCLNDGNDLAILEDLNTKFIKDLFLSFFFGKHSKSLQAQMMKITNETTKMGNGFQKSHLEMSSNYFADVENLTSDFIYDFLRFRVQQHSMNLSKPHEIIPKEVLKKMLYDIYFKMMASAINDYLDLSKNFAYMVQSSLLVFTDKFGNNNLSSGEISSSEKSLYNVSLECNDILFNMLTNIMNSSFLGNTLYTMNNNLLLYYNISEEEMKAFHALIKACVSTISVQKFLVNFKAYVSDSDGTNYSKSIMDFLKIQCTSLDPRRDSIYNSAFQKEDMASIYFLTFTLQKFVDDFLNNPFRSIFYHSQFDVNSLKPMCEFLVDIKIPNDRHITIEDINVMLLDHVNRFQEDVSSESGDEGNFTPDHLEAVLFLIITRYAAQNLTYARHLCSILKYPDSKDSKYLFFSGLDNPVELPSITFLCRVISKATDFNIFQKDYLDILAMTNNLTHLLFHFGEEILSHSSDNINMSLIHFLTRETDSILNSNGENAIVTQNEILINNLKDVFPLEKISKFQRHILPKNIFTILYLVNSIMDNQIMDVAENQLQYKILGSIHDIFSKKYINFESLLLHLLNNITGLIHEDNYDNENFLILENNSNEKIHNMIQNTFEMFIKLLNEAERHNIIPFILTFIKQHYVHNNSNVTLQDIFRQLKSIFLNDTQVKQFIKTLSELSSWVKISRVHDHKEFQHLILHTLQVTKEFMSTFLLPLKSQHHAIIYFIEYFEEGLINPQNLSNYCQSLYEKMDLEDFELLQMLQGLLKNSLSFLSENPYLIIKQMCDLSECKATSPGLFPVSLLEGISVLSKQFKDMESWILFEDFNCTSFILTSKQLYAILFNITSTIQDMYAEADCHCNPTSEKGHNQVEKLMSNIEQLFPDSTMMRLFTNVTKFQGLSIKDFLRNESATVSELQSLTNISEETINSILLMEVSKLQDLRSILQSVFYGTCEEHVVRLLLENTTKVETSLAVKEICAIPPVKFYQTIVHFIQNINFRNLVYRVSIPDEVQKMLNIIAKHISNTGRGFEKYQHVFTRLLVPNKLLDNMPLLAKLYQVLGGVQTEQSILHLIRLVASTICNEEPHLHSDNTSFNNLKVSKLTDDDMKKYNIPDNSTPFCLQLYWEILQSPNGAFTWAFLKPLIHGEILYTPDVPEIRELIHKANHTFRLLENLKTFSELWLTISMILKSSNQLLKDTQITQKILLNSFMGNYVERQLDLNLGDLAKKLQIYESIMGTMINGSVIQQINYLSQFVVNISSCLSFNRFFPLKSSKALEEEAKQLIQKNNFLASIHFNIPSSRGKLHKQILINKLPPHVKYTIRTNALYSMKTDVINMPVWRSHPRRLPGSGFTYSHVFVPIQDMIDRAIISLQTGTEIFEPEVQVQALPYPCHTRDLFLNNIGFFFPLIMMLTWIISVASMVRKLVYEKEIHLEEYMKMMGVHTSTNFLAWFLESLVVTIITSATIVLILKLSGILVHSNGIIVFLFVSEFGISIIMFSYMISTFFTNANTAAVCGSLFYMINFLPYIILLVLQKQFSFTIQCLLCLLSTTAFGQGIYLITSLESEGIGIQWNKMHQPALHTGIMSFGWTSWMIFIDSALYLTLGWYLNNVMPGPFGRRKMWNFPFMYSYWQEVFISKYKQKHFKDLNCMYLKGILGHKGSSDEMVNEVRKESPPTGKSGITFISVSKMYPNNKMAVKNLSLHFFENQITTILGPNGAGKTTILSLLNGMYLPTQGKIYVNGRDMETELSSIRMEMGVCPQYDVLFDCLTVKEHFLLFGSLKMPMWSERQLHQEVKQVIKDVGLSKHHLKYVYSLSGGMKRRLSVATAFIGNAKAVILDEPTSGVDPCSRRKIWDILLKHKEGRTIIFTTHNLDETEFLSDQIAIIHQGTLRCCGSLSFLKKKYGQHHELTLTKKNEFIDIVEITSLVQECIPAAFLKENSSTELIFSIPGEMDTTMCKSLFQKLDDNQSGLHISVYGITNTTMEKVKSYVW